VRRYTLCPTCHIGTLRETNTTYVRQLGARRFALVSVPNVLTWVCDMCGEHTYDQETIDRLEALLGPEASLGDEPRTRTRQRPADARSRDLRDWT
jgi:hypothetical protein